MTYPYVKLMGLLSAGALVGFLGAKQFLIGPRVQRVSQAEELQVLAVETGELYRSNKKLENEINELETQKSRLATASTTESENAIRSALAQLEIVTGKKSAIGPGVVIAFSEPLQVTDMVDLINALRNIGSEGISINNRRVVATTGISSADKIIVSVIGDMIVLSDALTRTGGILDQIGAQYTLERKDSITLPPTQ